MAETEGVCPSGNVYLYQTSNTDNSITSVARSISSQIESQVKPQELRSSWSLPSSLPADMRVRCDASDVKMHLVGLAYIQMRPDGFLELVSGQYKPDGTAAFEVVDVEAASEGRAKIFRLRNIFYNDYYLTGHIDTMTVDGHKERDDKWSQWTATKVPDNDDCKHCFKLQINAPHSPHDSYFYVKNQEFKIGEPKGFDIFQIETSD